MSSECIDRLCPSKACLIDDPKSSILLPREVAEEVVFRIDIVAQRTSAEKGVHIAAVRELTEDLRRTILAKIGQNVRRGVSLCLCIL